MIIRDKSDLKIEKYKSVLGLTGDVYVVDHFIESLQSHKSIFGYSTAKNIKEAEQERLEILRLEKSAELSAENAQEN